MDVFDFKTTNRKSGKVIRMDEIKFLLKLDNGKEVEAGVNRLNYNHNVERYYYDSGAGVEYFWVDEIIEIKHGDENVVEEDLIDILKKIYDLAAKERIVCAGLDGEVIKTFNKVKGIIDAYENKEGDPGV